ncbi:hypothetical protein [Candidatus Electronema sp. JM]|uniref:hypothetical protein n=1 Tax=Candidatus Electronema sp. JM TaxID=3401571 RepID=UPI003AA8A0C6
MSANVKLLLCGFNPEKRLQNIALAKAAPLRPSGAARNLCASTPPKTRQSGGASTQSAGTNYEAQQMPRSSPRSKFSFANLVNIPTY